MISLKQIGPGTIEPSVQQEGKVIRVLVLAVASRLANLDIRGGYEIQTLRRDGGRHNAVFVVW